MPESQPQKLSREGAHKEIKEAIPNSKPQNPSREEARRKIKEAIARARDPSSKEYRDVEIRKGQFFNIHLVMYPG